MRDLNLLWWKDLLGLLFPRSCQNCGKALNPQEELLCARCLFHLPRTNFHRNKENPVREIFGGILPLYSATSFLFFNKGGMTQKLVHRLKYKGKKEIGVYLGELLGRQLSESEFFRDADVLLPVPLHPAKQKKRGYNQSEIIASGMETVMKADLNAGVLFRKVHTSTQTRKSRYERWENVKDIFGVRNPAQLESKHVILVDDVITTGATLEACAENLIDIPGIRLSVASLAYSQA